MRDQFYPGWRVFIDGKEEPLLRANYINRAVFIEGGKHSVVFRFLPESLYTGYKLAGGGLAGAVIIFLVLYFRTRTKTKPDTISKLPENDSPDSSDNSGSPA